SAKRSKAMAPSQIRPMPGSGRPSSTRNASSAAGDVAAPLQAAHCAASAPRSLGSMRVIQQFLALGALAALLAGCQRAESGAQTAAIAPVDSPRPVRAEAPAKAPAKPLASEAAAAPSPGKKPDSGFLLTDVTRQLGFKDPQEHWPDGQFLTPEITPGGVAL